MIRVRLTYALYHHWHREGNIAVIGSAFCDRHLLNGKALADHFRESRDTESFKQQLNKLSGHFAVVIEDEEQVMAAVDLIRTFPIFIHREQDGISITDEIESDHIADPAERKHFLHMYCTLENNTLLRNWKQLQAGELLHAVKANDQFRIGPYYLHSAKPVKEGKASMQKQVKALEQKIIRQTLDYAAGRTILVPLSGGYDSRYLLALLAESGYPKLECFTYGRKESYEVLIAKNVAEKLKVKWTFIEYTDALLDQFFGEDWKAYSKLNHHFSSLPHEQDFFALYALRERQLLPEQALVVNGFCQDVHAGSRMTRHNIRNLHQYLKENYGVEADVSAYTASDNGLQEWIVKNRLSKFIVNSVRVYAFFGLDFYLPFWDKDWISFWYRLEPSLRMQERFYTDHLFKGIFNRNGIGFRKPDFDSADSLNTLRKVARTILPRTITDTIRQFNNKDTYRDTNNTLYLYEAIYKRLNVKPARKDYRINNIHALYLLSELEENHQF